MPETTTGFNGTAPDTAEQQYSALDALNKKLTAAVDFIAENGGAGNPDGRGVINLQDTELTFGIDFMTNGTLRSTLLHMLDERPEIRDWELDSGQIIVYRRLEDVPVVAEPAAIVDVHTKPFNTTHTEPLDNTDYFEPLADYFEPPDLTDPTVTRADMYAYGYTWDGMIPLGHERALELFDAGHGIYRLYVDDAEGMITERDEIFDFDGLFGTEDPAWVRPGREQPMEVFVYNPARHRDIEKTAEAVADGDGDGGGVVGETYADTRATADAPAPDGEWLTLPADAETLRDVLERIGVEGGDGAEVVITSVRVPDYLTEYISKNDSLDELNMLASYLNDMADHELEKLEDILSSGIADVERSAAGVTNLLYEDNFNGFVAIEAKDYEALGRYYEDEKPEDVSFEDFGKQNADGDKGIFINGGYIYHRYKEVSPEYDGVVPAEYKIVDAAVAGLPSKEPEPAKKPSVLQQIFAARKNAKTTKGKSKAKEKTGGKDAPKPKKHKGVADL